MNIQDKRSEITSLIDNIKKHSDRLMELESLPLLEISVVLSKINKLYESTLILKYLTAKEQNLLDTAFGTKPYAIHTILDEELEEEIEVEEPNNNTTETNEEGVMKDLDASSEEDSAELMASVTLSDDLNEEEVEVQEQSSGEVKADEVEAPKEEFVEEQTPVVEPTETEVQENPTEKENPVEEEEPKAEMLTPEPSTQPIQDKIKVDEILKEAESKSEVSSKPDLNEAFTTDVDTSLSGQMQKSAIPDLISAIGLNERYLYANDLFDGDMIKFKDAISTLNEFNSKEEALSYFQNTLAVENGWEKDNALAIALQSLVERRFSA